MKKVINMLTGFGYPVYVLYLTCSKCFYINWLSNRDIRVFVDAGYWQSMLSFVFLWNLKQILRTGLSVTLLYAIITYVSLQIALYCCIFQTVHERRPLWSWTYAISAHRH